MRAVTVAGTPITHYHIAAFVQSRDEEYDVLRTYITDGIQAGEKTIHICDPTLRDDHLERLSKLGVPVHACHRAGQLEVLSWHEAYLREGRFDTDTMLALVDEVVKASAAEGFSRVRLLGHMEWALTSRPGVDQFLEYETRVTEVLNRLEQPAICVYDLNRFSESDVVEIMRVHPFVVMGGVVRANPFYDPPVRFSTTQTAAS